MFLGNNIDFWLFHSNSIFPLPLLIVFISPSHLPHKSLLTGGTSWLFESPQTKRKAAIKSWGNSHILCQTFYCNKNKIKSWARDVDLRRAKDSQSKNPLGRSCTWTRVWSFAAAIIVIAPPPLQSAEERGGGGGGGVDGAARGSILPSPVPWHGVGVS